MRSLELDVGVLLGDLTGDFQEHAVGVLHDVGLMNGRHLAAVVLPRVLEGVTHDLLRARNTKGLDRHARLVAATLDLTVGGDLVDVADQLGGGRLALLELDARIKVFGVLADDHQVDGHFGEEGSHAGVVLAGPHAGVQAQLLPQVDVDAAEAGAYRGGDGRLQGTTGPPHAFHDGVGQRGAGSLHHVDARLLDIPVNPHAGGVDAAPRRLGQFRSHAIARNQRHLMSHARLSTHSSISRTAKLPRLADHPSGVNERGCAVPRGGKCFAKSAGLLTRFS